MKGFLQDIRYSLRGMRQAPGFTAAAVLTLVLGVGVNTLVFSVLHAVMFRPLPYRNSAHLVRLDDTSYESFLRWRERSSSFEDMAVYYRNTGWSRVNVRGAGETESVQTGFASANLFSLLGVSPLMGRTFTTEEERSRDHVA